MKSRARQHPAAKASPGRTAVMYVRVSSKEQEQGFSIPAQRQLLKDYAEREGIHAATDCQSFVSQLRASEWPADGRGNTSSHALQELHDFWHQRAQIAERVASREQHDHGILNADRPAETGAFDQRSRTRRIRVPPGAATRHCACSPSPSLALFGRRGSPVRASVDGAGVRQAGRARARSASFACSSAAIACSFETGRQTSTAKASAARANGAKGGRPRRNHTA